MRPRGTTLLEVVVASAILLVMMTAVFGAFYSSVRLMRWVGTNNDVGQSAMLGLNTLSRELPASAYQCLAIEPGPVVAGSITAGPILCFQVEVTDPAASMARGFQANPCLVLYYLDQTHQTLVRKEWPSPGLPDTASPSPTPPPSGVRMQTSDIATVLATTNGTEHVEATHVNVTSTAPGMLVVPSTYPTPTLTEGITITLDVKETPADGSPEEESAITTIYPRNHP